MPPPYCEGHARDIPPVAGAYVLVIELAAPVALAIGRKPVRLLPAGLYLYCGSAHGPGGLRARIARHMRGGKPAHWHVDHLTAAGTVRGAFVVPGGRECALAARLAHLPVPVPGFGSSDCPRCASHLFAWPKGAAPPQSLPLAGRRQKRNG